MEHLASLRKKYQVHAAMNICYHAIWRKTLPMHASRILGYAAKHGYSDIVDVATPLVIDRPASETAHHVAGVGDSKGASSFLSHFFP